MINFDFLDVDLFSPSFWTLAPVNQFIDASNSEKDDQVKESQVEDYQIEGYQNEGNQWVYTLTSTTDCYVEANDDTLASKIWFTSPVMHFLPDPSSY